VYCKNKKVESVKYLGVFLDQYLNYEQHVEYVSGKLRKLIYKFLQLRQVVNRKTIKMVYHSLTESVLTYGLVVWGLASRKTLKTVEVIQRAIVKIILFKNRRYPTKVQFQEACLFSLQQLAAQVVARFMIKYENYKLQDTSSHHTRAINKLMVPRMHYTKTQKHILYIGPKLYNKMPALLKNKPYSKSKVKIKSWIFDNNISINKL